MADEMKPELKAFRKKIAELELAGKTPRQLYKQAQAAYRTELDPLRQKIKGFARDDSGDFLDDDNKDLRLLQKEHEAQRDYLRDLAGAQRSQYVQQLRGEAGLPVSEAKTARMKDSAKTGQPIFTPITPKTNPFADVLKPTGMKKGGKAKAYKSGGSVSSASKRADGCAVKGKTKGRMV